MAILQQQSAEVRFREIDLSQTLIQESSANAGIVLVSKQGRPGLFHATSPDQFLAEYGKPSAKVSFGHHCALDYFREGNSLWVWRELGAGAKYSAAVLKDVSGVTTLASYNSGITDPALLDWTALAGSDTGLVAFYPKRGQGSYANTIGIKVKSLNLNAPSAPTVGSSPTGGTLTAATYAYRVSAIGTNGETLATSEASVVVASGTTNKVTITWTAVPGAIGYYVYGRTAGTTKRMAQVGALTLTYTDDGSVTPNAAISPITNAGNLPTALDEFEVEVYDTSRSTTNPVETFTCTLDDKVDDNGVQMEITQRINPFSEWINVVNNAPSLVSIPPMSGWTTQQVLAGGDSGAAVTNGAIQLAWDNFADPEKVDVDLLINAGYTDIGIQQKMDEVARGRGTTVALLDVPQTKQKCQAMIDYRNLELNLNSSYSALFGPDVLESDPYNGKAQYVPFSGWAAALCARTDRVANPWFAIAGLNRGLVNVLASRYKYNDAERTALFKAQVNYTRNFVGQGIALWEQMTLQGKASALQWLNVRRLSNVIKKSTYKFLMYSVHEPNDEFLRRTIVSSLSEYLEIIKNARGILNYLVVSNASNNPPALYNAGILKVTVFITPVMTAHELQVDLVITKAGMSLSEIPISNLG